MLQLPVSPAVAGRKLARAPSTKTVAMAVQRNTILYSGNITLGNEGADLITKKK